MNDLEYGTWYRYVVENIFLVFESLLFRGVGAGEKNTRSRSRPYTDRLHITACLPPETP